MPSCFGLDADRIMVYLGKVENSVEIADRRASDRTQNVSSTTARSLVAGKRCPQSCSLVRAVVLLPVYTAVIRQWVYMSQYTARVRQFMPKRIVIGNNSYDVIMHGTELPQNKSSLWNYADGVTITNSMELSLS
jgi:hypothetical protein